MMKLTLEEFRATCKVVVKDKDWCEDNMPGRDSCVVLEYALGSWIAKSDEARYYLIIGNWDYLSSDLAKLEEILYREWYLLECGEMDSEGGCHD